jgi:probable HAF family extracellular repeat protein
VSIARGEGVTYPDGSVSLYKAAFFHIGILEGTISSEITGVAAQDNILLGAVGYAIEDSVGSSPNGPVLFTPTKGTIVLPSPADRGGVATGISGDGRIKVGTATGSGPCYWDETNSVHILPHTDKAQSEALAISRDGSITGGYVAEDRENASAVEIGALWLTGDPRGKTRVDPPFGFDETVVYGLSTDGKTLCGGVSTASDSSSFASRTFVMNQGFMMSVLPTADEKGISFATGVTTVAAGTFNAVVGVTGDQAAYWVENKLVVLPSGTNSSYASAIDERAHTITGYITEAMGQNTAVIWDAFTKEQRGTVAGLLTNTYKIPLGKWMLTEANCISGDGYTIGGRGINPQGKYEGWVALLPAILYPPILGSPGPQHANLGEAFALTIDIKNFARLTGGVPTFSATGLPRGFSISEFGVITGKWSRDEAAPGDYTVTITAKNDVGSGSTTFTLTLPPPAPPQGTIDGDGFLMQNKPAGEPNYYTSAGNGVSANGQVTVGTDGIANDARAYTWTNTNGISGLPMVDGALRTYGIALAASADGNTIVGQAAVPPTEDGTERVAAVVWKPSAGTASKDKETATHYAESTATASTVSAINIGFFSAGTTSAANAVSADGSIVVGYGDDKQAGIFYQVYQAFRWTADTGMVGLGWLPGGTLFSQAWGISADGSTIVGVSASSNGTQAMRYTPAGGMAGLGLPVGATYGRAVAASANGSVIVGYNTFNDGDHAFRWTAAEGMTDLGVLAGDTSSRATAVSADGSIVVGQSAVGFNESRAFIWDKATGMHDLKSVIVAEDPRMAGWTLISANAISSDGKTITGAGRNPNGDLEGFTAVLQVRPAQPLNISTRMRVLTGDKVLIGGFIITGTESKKVVIRGIGPSLASAGLQGALGDPVLELHQGNSILVTNDNWKEHQAEVEATTIPPSNDLESAIVATLSPGAYTAILADKNNNPGIGLVEVYDLAAGANAKLANISTRGFVDTGDNVMIGGFIVGNGSVGGFGKVIVRAIGPSLTSAGVPGALPDTTLELFDGNGNSVATNDDWKLRPDGTSQQAEIEATTIPPKNDKESALVTVLAPGNYTAVVRGQNNATGVALVEAYNLQ